MRPDHRDPALDLLADATHGLTVTFPTGMPLPVQRLMATLGVHVKFDQGDKRRYAANQRKGAQRKGEA